MTSKLYNYFEVYLKIPQEKPATSEQRKDNWGQRMKQSVDRCPSSDPDGKLTLFGMCSGLSYVMPLKLPS